MPFVPRKERRAAFPRTRWELRVALSKARLRGGHVGVNTFGQLTEALTDIAWDAYNRMEESGC